jgi:hypothetical protein
MGSIAQMAEAKTQRMQRYRRVINSSFESAKANSCPTEDQQETNKP